MANNVAHKGESQGDTWNTIHTWNIDAEPGPLNPQKQQADEDIEGSTKWQTRGKKVDYRHLHDPFSDDKVMNTEELTNLLEGNDDQPTFNQAKCSSEWPEWEKAIQSKLAQLQQKGT